MLVHGTSGCILSVLANCSFSSPLPDVIVGLVCMDSLEHGIYLWGRLSAPKSCWRGTGYKLCFYPWPSSEGTNSSSAFEWEEVVYTLMLIGSPVAFELLCFLLLWIFGKHSNQTSTGNCVIEVYILPFQSSFNTESHDLIIDSYVAFYGGCHCFKAISSVFHVHQNHLESLLKIIFLDSSFWDPEFLSLEWDQEFIFKNSLADP